jgi:hypothetical protein
MRDVTVGFLMQIDKLVYLLESPIFIHLRLQLLNVESPHHAQLLKSLYGILMCLPQGEAFRLLNDRLTTVCNLRDNLGYSTYPLEMHDTENDPYGDDVTVTIQKPDKTVTRKLLERFDTVAELHRSIKDIAVQKVSHAAPTSSEIGSSNLDGYYQQPSSPIQVSQMYHHKSTTAGSNNAAAISYSSSYGANTDPIRNGRRHHEMEFTSTPSYQQQHHPATKNTSTDALLTRHPVTTSLQ